MRTICASVNATLEPSMEKIKKNLNAQLRGMLSTTRLLAPGGSRTNCTANLRTARNDSYTFLGVEM